LSLHNKGCCDSRFSKNNHLFWSFIVCTPRFATVTNMGATGEEQQSSQEEKAQPVDTTQNDRTEKNVEAGPSSPSSGPTLNSEELEPIVTLKTWIVTIVRVVA
jgi:hypothetical protein